MFAKRVITREIPPESPEVSLKFDLSNFSPWDADVADSSDDNYEDYDVDHTDVPDKVKRAYNGQCIKKNGESAAFAAPTFKEEPEKRQTVANGALGHRMELKCRHRKGCPRY